MSADRLAILWNKYLSDRMSEAERIEFQTLATDPAYHMVLDELVQSVFEQHPDRKEETDKERIFQQVMQAAANRQAPPRTVFFRSGWWAAAAVLLLLAVVTYFWKNSPRHTDIAISAPAKDIPSGKNGAILTLANGSQISLDTFKNAIVALQGGVTAKVVNGALVYEGKGDAVAYNTMRTPKGRQFMVTLPDGTQVWLNAASSIRYPTSFTGKHRSVEVTGEAYFEVAKHSEKPFSVHVNGKAEVAVLGTHFNINAYDNEKSIHTTLLEGSVKVSTKQSASQVILKPGEQAELNGTIKINKNIDIEKIMAWKNGLIYFEGATFDEIMRQLERWYDIEVVYENNKIPNKRLGGKMTRGVPLNILLKQLSGMGIRCKLNERTLMISM